MSPGRPRLPSLTAALAGLPAGIQAAGPWIGRRQLFVKFAQEAETATMYTADALRGELERLCRRAVYHSVSIGGRDPLDEVEYLEVVLRKGLALPAMLDVDGQRPEAMERLASAGAGALVLVQVVLDGCAGESAVERAMATLGAAAKKRLTHAVVILPHESASDAQLLRIVERTHAVSGDTSIVLHPTAADASEDDRRWEQWMEQATAVHGDVRLLSLLPAPTGMR